MSFIENIKDPERRKRILARRDKSSLPQANIKLAPAFIKGQGTPRKCSLSMAKYIRKTSTDPDSDETKRDMIAVLNGHGTKAEVYGQHPTKG